MIRVDYCKTGPAAAMKSLLRYLPLSLAVREAMRMRALADVQGLETPVLDIGCGDGLFWEVVTRQYVEKNEAMLDGLLGIDINPHELELASVRLADKGVDLKSIDISDKQQIHSLEELRGRFRTVIANCSIEHVPNLDSSLANIRTLLKDGDSRFYLFVPAPNWTETLAVKRFIRRFSPRLAGMYGGMLDGFFQHHHLYQAYVWQHLLEGNGFSEVEIVGLGSKAANRLFERWLLPAFGSFFVKGLVKSYPTTFQGVKAKYIQSEGQFLREVGDGSFITDVTNENVVEFFIRCKK
jgi:SAM-dependent methyltransferase